MTIHPDIPIVSVTLPEGATITKTTTWSGQAGFCIEVIYTLRDGRTFRGREDALRKKNVMASVTRANRAATEGGLFASFNSAGEFIGTMQHWVMGGPRMAERLVTTSTDIVPVSP